MADDPPNADRFSLRRWSRRKLEARGERRSPPGAAAAQDPAESLRSAAAPAERPQQAGSPTQASDRSAGAAFDSRNAAAAQPAVAAAARSAEAGDAARTADRAAESRLPPVDSLTIDSDFSPYMRAGVDPDLQRRALGKLFRDPRFNVMDGLDVYIDDYSKPSPIEPEVVRTLMQARYLFAPPKTRVNELGHVEDVPDAHDPREDARDATSGAVSKAHADAGAEPPCPDDSRSPNLSSSDAAQPGVAADAATGPVSSAGATERVNRDPDIR